MIRSALRSSSWFVIAGLVALTAIVTSCREDIFVEPPESLVGRYSGIYTFVAVRNGIDTVKVRSQYINWQFKSTSYLMSWDTSGTVPIPPDTTTDRQFCDNKGQYDLSSGITLLVDSDGENLRNSACITSENPDGFFSLDQSRKNPDPSQGDTIYMLQVSQNGPNEETRLIRLVKKESL